MVPTARSLFDAPTATPVWEHPDINTGSHPDVEIRIDWVSATMTSMPPDEVARALSAYTRDEWRPSETGSRGGYTRSYLGPERARIGYHPEGRHRDEREVLVDLPGGWCEAAGPVAVREVLTLLAGWDARCTRIDLAGDDLGRRAEVAEVVAELRAGRFTSRSRPRLETLRLDGPGHQAVIGAPSSNRQLSIYDKGAESGGARPGVRWELSERHDAAPEAMARLLAGNLGDVWRSRLVSFIDFAHDGARAPWFEALVTSATRVPALAPRRAATLESRKATAEGLVGMYAHIEREEPGFMDRYRGDVVTEARRPSPIPAFDVPDLDEEITSNEEAA